MSHRDSAHATGRCWRLVPIARTLADRCATAGRTPDDVQRHPMPVRPVIALWGTAPRVAHRAFRLIGLEPFTRRAAEEGESAGR